MGLELAGTQLMESTLGCSDVTFTLLGPLEVRKDGEDCAPTAPKVLQLLALLLLQPGKTVHIDAIIKELWAGEPPRSVRTTVQTYIYQLRRCIEQNGLAEDADTLLATRAPGYVFRVDESRVDVAAFRRLCQEGKDLLRIRNFVAAADKLRAAEALWSGTPLGNVQCGPVLRAYAINLQEQLRAAMHLRLEAELACGRHRDAIGELRQLVADNPFDEGLHGLLMKALSACGRRSDALAAYRSLRATLAEELGVEPCDELQRMHHDVLSARTA